MDAFIWVVAGICAVLYVAMGMVLGPVALPGLRLQFTYSGAQFERIYRAWNEGEKRRYARHFKLDYPFLVAYGLLGFLIAQNLSTSASLPMEHEVLQFMPPAAAALDAIEDTLHIRIIRSIDKEGASDGLSLYAGIAATTKWLLIGVFLLLILIYS